MTIKRNLVLLAIVVILLTNFLVLTDAQKVTGSIGNSRMVLKMEVGETLSRSILVKNVNDFPVKIDITVTGDLVNKVGKVDKTTWKNS